MTGNGNQKFIEGLSGEYLSPNDVKAINHLFESGFDSIQESYIAGFNCTKRTAKSAAFRWFARPAIRAEFKSRIIASGMTEEWVKEKVRSYVEMGEADVDRSLSGVKALELASKIHGMTEGESSGKFGGMYLPVLVESWSPEREAEMRRKTEENRIVE